MDSSLLRLIDANLNRAKEGIRVIEEFYRFKEENKLVSLKLRNLRHLISKAENLLPISYEEILQARDVLSDPNKEEEGELKKNSYQLLKANFSRIEESLRVLEEVSTRFSISASKIFQKSRFFIYNLEKETLLTLSLKHKIYGVYVILPDDIQWNLVLRKIKVCLEEGVKFFQLRDKTHSDKEVLKRGKQLKEIIKKYKSYLIINDRVDVAYCVKADGVHLGNDDLPVDETRKILGEEAIIGVSVDSIDEAKLFFKKNINYISLGPIFKTRTKKDVPSARGCYILSKLKKISPEPVVGVGGINVNNIKETAQTKVDAVAICSGIMKEKNTRLALKKILKYFPFR
jgi:thiamine-phosphate pyrophosphorylase